MLPAILTAAVVASHIDEKVRDLEEEVVRLRLEVAGLRQNNTAPRRAETCHGQGYYYEDVHECLCFTCFSGVSCEDFNATCVLDDGMANPYLYEEYWRKTANDIVIPMYLRSPYDTGNSIVKGRTYAQGKLLPHLKKAIFRMHEKVNNVAHLDRKSLVIGAGGTELINAATWACKQMHAPNGPMNVVSRPPYYNGYPDYVALTEVNMTFSIAENLDPSTVTEWTTLPNNPTNEFRKPIYENAACPLYDLVYFWPPTADLTKGGAPLDHANTLFSMAKLTGHAGTRLGWMLVDDPNFADLMTQYIGTMQIHISTDTMYRSMSVLNYLLDVDKLAFFSWARDAIDKRWAVFQEIFENGQTRFKQHADVGGFTAWVECLLPEEAEDCAGTFNRALVGPHEGTGYGGSAAFVRFELGQPTVIFDLMVSYLRKMVA